MLLLQCFTLRKFHMMRVKARIITSDRRCKRHACDHIAFILSGMLAAYMSSMRNRNLEIRIVGSSVRPQ